MCERCTGGFAFFGLAEPQAAMLDAYIAAIRDGWLPVALGALNLDLEEVEANPNRFLDRLADRNEPIAAADGNHQATFVSLTRWLWDGEFCGEISLTSKGAAEFPDVICSLVPHKRAHGYESRALRQVTTEARELGLHIPAGPHDDDRGAGR